MTKTSDYIKHAQLLVKPFVRHNQIEKTPGKDNRLLRHR